MSQTRSTLEKRLEYDKTQLVSLDAHIVELEAAEHEARLAFDSARARLDVAVTQLNELRERRTALSSSTGLLHRLLLADVLQRVPTDIWREIFLLVVDCDATSLRPDVLIERIRTPFVLASVCSLWRRIAVDARLLWSFVFVSETIPGTLELTLELVSLLMKRSRNAPLHIVLLWEDDDEWDGFHAEVCATLAKEACRWRRFEISFPRGGVSYDDLGFLCHPTPLLERASFLCEDVLNSSDWQDEDEIDYVLPVCPRLRYFSCQWENILFAPSPAAPPPITFLVLKINVSFAVIWAILWSSPYLKYLRLAYYQYPDEGALDEELQDSSLVLESLESLYCDDVACVLFAANAAFLTLPALTDFTATIDDVRQLAPLLPVFKATLETLTLEGDQHGTLDVPSIDVLQPLEALHSVAFVNYTVTDEFIGAMAFSVDPLWPRLLRMRFGGRAKAPRGLLDMLRARNDASREPGRPRAIRRIIFATSSATPAWQIAQIQYFLAQRQGPGGGSAGDPSSSRHSLE